MGQESDSKSKLVIEICSISTRSASCVHRILSNPTKTTFIDWYCILGVEENAGVNLIRKRYHKLALQLHPDKNKHPKAEIAFKLVSEANACLTNVAKREAFDFERYKHFCIECKRIPYTTSANVSVNSGGSGFKAWNIITKSRSFKFWRNIKDVRERFNEEAKVIENCLRVNSMSRKESPLYNPGSYLHRSKSMHRFEKETPVFNPSDYLYQGYPHMRGLGNKNPSTFMYLQMASILQNEKRGAQHSSPVFEVKTRSMFTNQFAFVSSRY